MQENEKEKNTIRRKYLLWVLKAEVYLGGVRELYSSENFNNV